MLISYNLLQTYFAKKLPKPEALADALTFHAFEIEGMEKKGGDTAIDVKVLPNRAHDCLSHEGVAREVSAILQIPLKKLPKEKYPKSDKRAGKITVEIKDKRAIRYQALVIDGVKVGPSPKWLVTYLEALGQRSVNNIVDATNYVMFQIGQPLHAFDYDKLAKVKGFTKIMVRAGKEEETITTLDGKTITLNPDVIVIADVEGALGIAGIKGGVRAEIDENTKNIVLESANFEAESVRRSSMRLGIKTDASKRFESGLTPYSTDRALLQVSQMIVDVAKTSNTRAGTPIDMFAKKPKQQTVAVSVADICGILGADFTEREIESVWKRLSFSYLKRGKGMTAVYTVRIPFERLDLSLREDLVEEVGRLAGYHKLTPTLPKETVTVPELNKEWMVRNHVREIMLAAGFSDVYTYGFNNRGEIEMANPISTDKKFLRNNLMGGLKEAVQLNLKYDSEVRVFEFGHIFGKTDGQIREESSFAALMGFLKRKEAQTKEDFYVLKGILETIFSTLHISDVHYKEAGGELVASVYVEKELLGTMSVNGFELDFAKLTLLARDKVVFTLPSRFPSIIRDVSLFVPISTKAGEVEGVIQSNMGNLAQSLTLIDIFEQPGEGRKSLAFRMVLQSFEKTLSDDEANGVMAQVIDALERANTAWQVRK